MPFVADANRYDGRMLYRYSGNSGLKLPAVSLGLWHNFGFADSFANMKDLLFTAFNAGITHFDLANNYGPPPGSAEENFGKVINGELKPYRDELVISTKAGFRHWDGPYGDRGSRKYLLASLDQSLRRMGLEYVDIFYHHRPDDETPIEESMMALDQAVRQGKALYVGISNYRADQAEKAIQVLRELKTPFIIHQNRYSILDRNAEQGGLKTMLAEKGVGLITYSPLAQGLLTNRYLHGIPTDSRAGNGKQTFLSRDRITEQQVQISTQLNEIAQKRGQTLAQMALSWILKDETTTSVLIGASKPSQITDCVGCLKNLAFSPEELAAIDRISLSK